MMGLLRKKVAPPALEPGVRVYAIGDIHGRLDLFDRLLALLQVDNAERGRARARVILLGDLIDRGPDSAGVVRRAMAPLGWASLTALMGNHESAMIEALDGDRPMLQLWLGNGGVSALRSWGVPDVLIAEGTNADIIDAAIAAIAPAERAWLLRARQSVQIGDYYFVHAGVRPHVALDRQQLHDSLWIREEFLDSKADHRAMIVHGHSVSVKVEERPNRIGIDTGAYATGRLTALGLEGTARWFIHT